MLLDEMLTFYDPLVDTDMDCKCVILGMFHHSCVTVGYEYTEHLQSEDGSDGGGGIDNVPQTPKAGGIGIANVASKQPQAQKGKGASAGNAEVRGRGRGGGGGGGGGLHRMHPTDRLGKGRRHRSIRSPLHHLPPPLPHRHLTMSRVWSSPHHL